MFVKKYLKRNYNLNSFLIPATIPKKYKWEGYLDISHVALAIPINRQQVYIADPAFYFLNPIKVDLNNFEETIVYSKDVYKEDLNKELLNYISIDKIIAKTKILNTHKILNKYQEIQKNTIFSECYYSDNSMDKWRYYLREVTNPDKSISTFFINIRQNPFITSTIIDRNGICYPDTYLSLNKNSELIISENSAIKKNINIAYLDDDEINDLDRKLEPYFKGSLKDYIKNFSNNPKKYLISD